MLKLAYQNPTLWCLEVVMRDLLTWIPSFPLGLSDMTWLEKRISSKNLEIKNCKTEILFSILHQIFHQRTAQMIDDHENLGIVFQQLGGSLELMPSMGFQTWMASGQQIHRKIVEDTGVSHICIYIYTQPITHQHLISYHYHVHVQFHYHSHIHDHCHIIIHHIHNAIHISNLSICNMSVRMSFP